MNVSSELRNAVVSIAVCIVAVSIPFQGLTRASMLATDAEWTASEIERTERPEPTRGLMGATGPDLNPTSSLAGAPTPEPAATRPPAVSP